MGSGPPIPIYGKGICTTDIRCKTRDLNVGHLAFDNVHRAADGQPGSATAGCDKCGDPVKFNVPGLPNACYDSPHQK
jgi:hypothetical protein